MLTPAYVNLNYWFYPLGNTPAANLLRDIHPAKGQQLEILSLASGDVRNILCTLWCQDGSSHESKYRFTSCDYEPAVIARNIFLLTLIPKLFSPEHTDRHKSTWVLWDLYYHMSVSEDALDVLRNHASDLLQTSVSPQSWASSPYGDYLKSISRNTLSDVRRFWYLYAATEIPGIESDARKSMESTYESRKNTEIISGFRATGVHGLDAAKDKAAAFQAYWKTGVVAGEVPGSLKPTTSGRRMNPLFLHSSASYGKFAVHYGSDPLLGFHLAEAFDRPMPTTKRLNAPAKLAICIMVCNFR